MWLFSFVYVRTPKIFRIILSALFVSLKTLLLALASWKMWGIRIFFDKIHANVRGFCRGILRKGGENGQGLLKCHLDETCDKQCSQIKKIISKKSRDACALWKAL